jgi:hypothetical protein
VFTTVLPEAVTTKASDSCVATPSVVFRYVT